MNDGSPILCFCLSVLFPLFILGLLLPSSFRLRCSGGLSGIIALLLLSLDAFGEEGASPTSKTLSPQYVESDDYREWTPLANRSVNPSLEQIIPIGSALVHPGRQRRDEKLLAIHSQTTESFVERKRVFGIGRLVKAFHEGWSAEHYRIPQQPPADRYDLLLLPALPSKSTPLIWRGKSVYLVGLLRHDKPVAYDTDSIPPKIRPLTAFENEGVRALRTGKLIYVREGADQLQMMGAICAVKQCLKCHDCETGDMLGAFSYRFDREGSLWLEGVGK